MLQNRNTLRSAFVIEKSTPSNSQLSARSNSVELEPSTTKLLDEFLSYAALRHATSVVCEDANNSGGHLDSGDGYNAVLSLYPVMEEGGENCFPKLRHALSIVSAMMTCNMFRLLSLLSREGGRWGIFCRCCVAPAMPTLRAETLRHYNKSLGPKNVDVNISFVCSLLGMDEKEAIPFCVRGGLPVEVEEVEGEDWENDFAKLNISASKVEKTVVFHTSSVISFDTEKLNKGTRMDSFVLGSGSAGEVKYMEADSDGVTIWEAKFLYSLLQERM